MISYTNRPDREILTAGIILNKMKSMRGNLCHLHVTIFLDDDTRMILNNITFADEYEYQGHQVLAIKFEGGTISYRKNSCVAYAFRCS